MPELIYDVHAFTNGGAHSGNPAGVCLLNRPRPEAWMQDIAARMQHSETAFVLRGAEGFDLRWFTPEVEVDLCGHATLAAAHVLWETGWLSPGSEARFHSRSGVLKARPGQDGWITLNFPREAPEERPAPDGLLEALGLKEARWVGGNRMDYLVEVADRPTLLGLTPDHSALRRLPVRGVIVTTEGEGAPFDFHSRFFAPGAGVPEDPVTGSAHCALGPYWAARLGKETLLAHQDSARGGVLRIAFRGDRILLSGQAQTIYQAEVSRRWPAL